MSSRVQKQEGPGTAWRPTTDLPQKVLVGRGAQTLGAGGGVDLTPHEVQVQEAHRRGYREGEAAGKAAVDAAVQRLAQTVESLAALRGRARREAEEDLLRLAVAIARRILHRELNVDPEAVCGLIKAALEKMQSQEIHRVRVHPDLETPVRHGLEQLAAGRNIQVVAERGRQFGDVVFETERGSLDASVETQLQEIGRGLADRLRGRA
jgi:flagellar assembly protein FliH